MTVIGYIVQYSDEDDYTIYHGFMKLFRSFSDALEHAKELTRMYVETHDPDEIGHFQSHTPTKKNCDNQGSVVVFECRGRVIWIDCVVE
jgi:hypothetical protein